jgi:uncharacterized protein YqeY
MPSLKQRLHDDLTASMRARDDVARAALRMVLAAISRAEVAGRQHATLTDDQVTEVIRSEIRKRMESAEIYGSAGRSELADRERAEAEVLSAYLPAREEGGADGRMTGLVIRAVRERVGSRAAGARIAEAVKRALAAGS